MDRLRLKYRSYSAAIALLLVTSICLAETPVDTVPKQALDAKFAYCRTCHGIAAQGFRGVFPIPRLAGQQPQYIENQLKAFIEKRRTNPVMFRVAHVLSPAMVAGLAARFQALNPKPLGGAPKNLVAAGNRSFRTAFLSKTSRPAPRATVLKRKVMANFRASPASSMTTSSTSSLIGLRSAVRIRQNPTHQRLWRRSPTS